MTLEAACRKIRLRQVFICLRPRTPLPPHILYKCIQYSYSHRDGGRVNQSEGYWGNSSQSWVENANMTDCMSSLKTLINTCRKVPLKMTTFYTVK